MLSRYSPDLLIFDCDGVLVDSEMIASENLAAHLRDHGVDISAMQCRNRFTGYSLDRMMAELIDDGARLPDDFLATLRQRDIIAFARNLKPLPGIISFLKESTVPRCVASSGITEKIRTNLHTTGLLGFFERAIFSADMVANAKPAPDLFLLAARDMGADPERCLVIEDSALGVAAAISAGMRVFGFSGGSHCGPGYPEMLQDAGASAVFADMADLTELIEAAY